MIIDKGFVVKKVNILVLFALLAAASFSLQAQDSKDASPVGIKKSDVNKDGVVSLEEYLAGEKVNATKMFQHIDANGDGKLDAAEQKDVDEVMKSMYSAPMPAAEKPKTGISM